MGAPRGRTQIKSRKRREDEGEEEGDAVQGVEDDSISGASVTSDGDDDADAEGSDDNASDSSSRSRPPSPKLLNGHREREGKPSPSQNFAATGDTTAMMNGLTIDHDAADNEVHFDDMQEADEAHNAQGIAETVPGDRTADRRRKEHEDYKKRRDADPAFVPNRGEFFMHDHRSAGPGQSGFRPFGRGNMRGKGVSRGVVQMTDFPPSTGPADSTWAHDLHDPAAEPLMRQSGPRTVNTDSLAKSQRPGVSRTQAPNREFSTTTRLGDMQIKLFISGMDEPKLFANVARKTYTRLPYHRPPLRRDKPVRISIPNMEVKYIFPAVERSFIFIPRAMRPNQQGFGKSRARGSFGGAGYVNFGPLSSRRTSLYGGSTYSPNAILSRRSSIARDAALPILSPTQGTAYRPIAPGMDAGKPVVRLPPASEQPQRPSTHSPTVNLPRPSAYAAPQQPMLQEFPPKDLPMHHPKPERSLQVGDIVSPTANDFRAPSATHQQPFHQQNPLQMPATAYGPLQQVLTHSRHPSHPSQASNSTPLQHIPEAAIHAQPFHPYGYPTQQGFYPSPYPMYYYPSPGPGADAGAASQGFVPGQQYFYPMPVPAPPPAADPTTQAATVAHETGGTVYYFNPSDLPPAFETPVSYPPEFVPAPAQGMDATAGSPFYQNPIFPPPLPQ